MMDTVEIGPDLTVPMSELRVRFSRSGGPGGQHVNTSATRAEIYWSIPRSAALSEEQRERLLKRLASRLDSHGTLRIVADDTRSQRQNRVLALNRFRDVVAGALKRRRKRRPTRPTAAARERRMDTKRRRSDTKQQRRTPDW